MMMYEDVFALPHMGEEISTEGFIQLCVALQLEMSETAQTSHW